MASAFGDPMAPSTCEQCGNATEGTMRCSVQDSKSLCQGCFQDLPQARREDIGDQIWFCDIHLHRKADIFCETCQLGCCKECAADVHQGHKMEDVLKLEEEIRRDLNEHFQEVGVRAEERNELRRKIKSSLRKIEKAPKFLDKVVDEIKKEVAKNLEKENNRIEWETQQNILHQERRRDNMLKHAKEKADLDIQRIQEIQRGISTAVLTDAEKRRCKIQKAESKLLVGQQACESANLQITSMLESSAEKLVREGRQLCSLVKASSAFQCQDDVLDCCREVEADLPKLKIKKCHFFKGLRPFLPLAMIVHYICVVVLCSANEARRGYEYNRVISPESMNSLIILYSYFPLYNAKDILVLTSLLLGSIYDYPITRIKVFMKKLKSCVRNWNTATRDSCIKLMVELRPEFGNLEGVFLILVYIYNPLLYLSRVNLVSANTVSISSIVQPQCRQNDYEGFGGVEADLIKMLVFSQKTSDLFHLL